MLADGQKVGDGSWVLSILVTDLNLQNSFRVHGDMHIGGVMLRLVEEIDVTRDWSDHALWWPQRNRWLKQTRLTLDQCGVSADSVLLFTPMHKAARIEMPDLQFVDVSIDFSIPSFDACVQLGRSLGVRHPEELGFKRQVDVETLKKIASSDRRGSFSVFNNEARTASPANRSLAVQQHSRSAYDISAPTPLPQSAGPGLHPHLASASYTNSLPRNVGSAGTFPHANNVDAALKPSPQYFTLNGGKLPPSACVSWEGLIEVDQNLASSPQIPAKDGLQRMFRPKNYIQKASLNAGWLDSSRSLMEQGIHEGHTVLLRFKYLTFFDLNPKYDPVRINQIYEQAKWAVLAEELDCTDEEMFMFAALQLQVSRQSSKPQPDGTEKEKDVEAALDELELTLEGVNLNGPGPAVSDITSIPELTDHLRYMKPKKLGLKGWKRAYFVFKDLSMAYFASVSDSSSGRAIGRLFLKGAEVTPSVNLRDRRFVIRLLLPNSNGMSEFCLKCDSEQQYAKWMAGCKLASRGRTMADSSYQSEVESLSRLLDMQHPTSSSVSRARQFSGSSSAPTDFAPEDFLPMRAWKKMESRNQLAHRIKEAHSNVENLALSDAKLQYIKAWQALPEYAVHYFIVHFKKCRKPDLIGITPERMIKMHMDNGHHIKTWRFSNITKWHVNWEIKMLNIQVDDTELLLSCLSADCKIPHEFIGGYIFLSLRSKDQNQSLNTEQFHKLTGGRMPFDQSQHGVYLPRPLPAPVPKYLQ